MQLPLALPEHILQSVFSHVDDVDWKVRMRRVSPLWNRLLQSPHSFSATHSLSLRVFKEGEAECMVGYTADQSQPEVHINVNDFFNRFLPNLKLVTSFVLNCPGRYEVFYVSFIKVS
jgi:hypothetical protein